MIELVDNKLLKDGKEIDPTTALSDWELDQLIKQFDSSVPSTREWSRKQTSWSGCHMNNVDWLEDTSGYTFIDHGNCVVADLVFTKGGTRLLTLYCNKFNFYSAATDLGISYSAMVKWFQRWRKSELAAGLRPEDLGVHLGLTETIKEYKLS